MLRLLTGGSSTVNGWWGKFLNWEMLNEVSVHCRNLWCKTWSYKSTQFKIHQSFVLRITFFKFFICIILKIKQCSCGIGQFISPIVPSMLFPSDHTMALGSTQPLLQMSTRNIPGGKGGRCVRLTTSPPSREECHEIWSLNLLEPFVPHQACYRTPYLLCNLTRARKKCRWSQYLLLFSMCTVITFKY